MIMLLILSLIAPSNTYNAWTDTGVHLIIDDNGTPNNFDDDFIIDWETNRQFKISIQD